MKVIVLTGLTAAGKSSICHPTSSKFDIPLLETGTIIYETVKEKGLPITPENIKQVTMEGKNISDSYFTEKLVEFANQNYRSRPALFISGVRALSEVDYLKKVYGKQNVLVIGFHASQDTRFNRLDNLDRKSQGGAKALEDKALRNFDTFLEREKKELVFGIGTIFAMADVIISNDDKKYPFYTVEHNQFIFESVVRNFIDF
jgi:dephospho-CoA kinase